MQNYLATGIDPDDPEISELSLLPERKRKPQSKDQAIYGIWADDPEEEDSRADKRARFADTLSKPMGFVSAGVVSQSDLGTDAKQTETRASPTQVQSDRKADSSSNSHNEETAPKLVFKTFGKQREKQRVSAPEVSKKPLPSALDKDFGKFEAHTKGIGLKLLQKMGFTGRLGKRENGIAVPIQPKVTPAIIGKNLFQKQVARNKEEEELEAKKALETRAKADAVAAAAPSNNWRRGVKKVAKQYKTAAELTATAVQAVPDNQVVIDARGPHVRVTTLDKIASISTPEQTPTALGLASQLPELQHNVRLLVDLTEADIHKIARDRKRLEENVVTLEQQRDRLEVGVQKDREMIGHLENILATIDEYQSKQETKSTVPLSSQIEEVGNMFQSLQSRFPKEYASFHLSDLAVAIAFPLLKSFLSSWLPLFPMSSSSNRGTLEVVPVITRWKMLLEGDGSGSEKKRDQVYSRFLRQVFLPKVYQAVGMWDARDAQSLITLLRSVKPLLPDDIYSGTLLLHTVIPKLKTELSRWNPRTDPVPVHTWIHPWLPILPDEAMQPLYRDIRQKLTAVLQDWHASDQSALIVIAPWHSVFKEEDYEIFIMRCIIPKLTVALHDHFVINPQQQQLEPFQWVMAWEKLINARLLIKVLDMEFFPKWLHALFTWLSNSPRFDEVSAWYTGWKSQFPTSLRDNPAIKVHFNQALDLMNAALNKEPLLPVMQRIMASFANVSMKASQLPAFSVGVRPSSVVSTTRTREVADDDDDLNFREIVEQFAAYHDMPFIPNLKRGKHDGKQIFSFGKLNVYLDNRCIYLYDRSTDGSPSAAAWRPIALDELLVRAKEAASHLKKAAS